MNIPKIPTCAPRPEFIRPPSRGGDPIFGLSRSLYYRAEKDGKLQFTRIKAPGKLRGVVMISVAEIERFIAAESETTPSTKGAATT